MSDKQVFARCIILNGKPIAKQDFFVSVVYLLFVFAFFVWVLFSFKY